jgi:hypothetical protein
MMNYRVWSSAVLLAITGVCFAQSWNSAYEAGIRAGRALKWDEARQEFKQAAAYRPEDVTGPTILPGPPTAPRRWRDGAPYSPNFLAAYSLYRSGLANSSADQQTTQLNSAAKELEMLLSKRQVSPEAYFTLSVIYNKLADSVRLKALQDKYASAARTSTWKVDTEVMRPEELSDVAAFVTGDINGAKPRPGNTRTAQDTISVQELNQATGQILPIPGAAAGTILQLPNKFALVIGVSNPNLAGNLDYSGFDAQRVKDALITSAGYIASNVDLLVDPTAATMHARAMALAARMPDSGTLCIYYSGVGTNIDGSDYLAGTDAASLDSPAGMIKKSDLFAQFFPKSTHLFVFFQVDRSTPGTSSAFGSERLYEGSVSEMQATISSSRAYPTYQNGKKTGLFTNAFVLTLADLQSNQIPILEFGWQVFNHIRRGNTGKFDGSSRQIPTLPALNDLATDAPF